MKKRNEQKIQRAELSPELVAQAKGGSSAAFTELYEQTSPELYRSVRSMVHDEDLAWDILQDSYLRAFQSLDKLGANEAFLVWLRRIAVNETARRMSKRLPLSFTELAADEEDEGQPQLTDLKVENQPELALDRKETSRLVREIVAQLPEEQQLIVGMRYYEELSVKEISELLELSPGTVKAQLFKGRKKVEQAVRKLEKQGVKLYGLSPLPFLVALLHRLEPPKEAERKGLTTILTRLPGAEGAVSAMTAGQALLHSLGAKLAAAAMTLLLLGGGIWAGIHLWKSPEPEVGIYRPPRLISYFEDPQAEAERSATERESERRETEPREIDGPSDRDRDPGEPDASEPPRSSDSARPTDPSRPPDPSQPGQSQRPTEPTQPSETPPPSENPRPSETPQPSETPRPSDTPQPPDTPEPSNTPEPPDTPEHSDTPNPSESGETPEPSGSSEPPETSSEPPETSTEHTEPSTEHTEPSTEHTEPSTEPPEPPETLLSGTYGYNDRIHWSLDLETGELKLWGNPSWVNSDMSSTSADIPWSSYRSSVQTVNISQGVKRVGYYAFQGCTNLRSVTLPSSLDAIERYAFDGCTALSSITIPDNIERIENYAFRGCTSLTAINIPDGVTEIRSYAFEGCTGLTSIQVPDSVTSIGDAAFYKCSGLTSATLPDGIRAMANLLFGDCTSLRSFTIPKRVTMLGIGAFSGCPFSSITLPDGMLNIGMGAFSGCKELQSITIPASVNTIYSDAFTNCPQLTIRGYAGSYAETYANNHNIPFEAITP